MATGALLLNPAQHRSALPSGQDDVLLSASPTSLQSKQKGSQIQGKSKVTVMGIAPLSAAAGTTGLHSTGTSSSRLYSGTALVPESSGEDGTKDAFTMPELAQAAKSVMVAQSPLGAVVSTPLFSQDAPMLTYLDSHTQAIAMADAGADPGLLHTLARDDGMVAGDITTGREARIRAIADLLPPVDVTSLSPDDKDRVLRLMFALIHGAYVKQAPGNRRQEGEAEESRRQRPSRKSSRSRSRSRSRANKRDVDGDGLSQPRGNHAHEADSEAGKALSDDKHISDAALMSGPFGLSSSIPPQLEQMTLAGCLSSTVSILGMDEADDPSDPLIAVADHALQEFQRSIIENPSGEKPVGSPTKQEKANAQTDLEELRRMKEALSKKTQERDEIKRFLMSTS
jgi:hypothetical protein